ncbi:hypothetical protein KA005_70950 [bacterium]|nr:hypothetical protein [bacterium]
MKNDEESKRAAEEVDLMNKSFTDLYGSDGDSSTDAPTTDISVETDAPATDEPATDTPSTDAPATDAPKTDAPATDAPTTDVPDERDQTIADLRAKLAEKEDKKKTTTDAPTTLAPLDIESQDFIGDADIEGLTTNKEAFNKLLNTVYSKGISDARNVINEGISGSIPSLVSNQVNIATEMKEIKDTFYTKNEDLKPFPNVVSTVFEDLAKENPTEIFTKIIESVAPEVRKRLNLPEPTIKTKNDKGDLPRLPRKKGKSGRSQPKPKTSSVESELDAMNEVLGR